MLGSCWHTTFLFGLVRLSIAGCLKLIVSDLLWEGQGLIDISRYAQQVVCLRRGKSWKELGSLVDFRSCFCLTLAFVEGYAGLQGTHLNTGLLWVDSVLCGWGREGGREGGEGGREGGEGRGGDCPHFPQTRTFVTAEPSRPPAKRVTG